MSDDLKFTLSKPAQPFAQLPARSPSPLAKLSISQQSTAVRPDVTGQRAFLTRHFRSSWFPSGAVNPCLLQQRATVLHVSYQVPGCSVLKTETHRMPKHPYRLRPLAQPDMHAAAPV